MHFLKGLQTMAGHRFGADEAQKHIGFFTFYRRRRFSGRPRRLGETKVLCFTIASARQCQKHIGFLPSWRRDKKSRASCIFNDFKAAVDAMVFHMFCAKHMKNHNFCAMPLNEGPAAPGWTGGKRDESAPEAPER